MYLSLRVHSRAGNVIVDIAGDIDMKLGPVAGGFPAALPADQRNRPAGRPVRRDLPRLRRAEDVDHDVPHGRTPGQHAPFHQPVAPGAQAGRSDRVAGGVAAGHTV